jgi:hypothetical protein
MRAQPGAIDVSGSEMMFRRSPPIRLAWFERILAGLAAVGASVCS